jgi:hypothetical protein
MNCRYHDREDTLFHFARIFSTEDNHLHALEVDFHRGGRAHTLCEAVGGELASVVDDEIGLAKVGELSFSRSNEHVMLINKNQRNKGLDFREAAYHKQGMVRSGTNDSNFNAVFRIPLNGKNNQPFNHDNRGQKDGPLQIRRKRKRFLVCSGNQWHVLG